MTDESERWLEEIKLGRQSSVKGKWPFAGNGGAQRRASDELPRTKSAERLRKHDSFESASYKPHSTSGISHQPRTGEVGVVSEGTGTGDRFRARTGEAASILSSSIHTKTSDSLSGSRVTYTSAEGKMGTQLRGSSLERKPRTAPQQIPEPRQITVSSSKHQKGQISQPLIPNSGNLRKTLPEHTKSGPVTPPVMSPVHTRAEFSTHGSSSHVRSGLGLSDHFGAEFGHHGDEVRHDSLSPSSDQSLVILTMSSQECQGESGGEKKIEEGWVEVDKPVEVSGFVECVLLTETIR